MSPRACKTCQWWRPIPASGPNGECRAAPPAVDQGTSVWPTTGATDWCGAHQVRADLVGGDVRSPRIQEPAA